MKPVTAAGIGLLALACGSTKETQTQMQMRMAQEAVAVKTALAPIAQAWQRWVAAGQADSIAASFIDAGRQMPPNEPAAVGRAAIRARNARLFATHDTKLIIRSEDVIANGPLAVERGSFQLDATPKSGAPKGTAAIHDAGKYLQRWQLVNGRWLLADQEWNSDRPLAMAAAPAKAAAKKSGAKAKSTKKKR